MKANELMVGDWVMDGGVAARVTSLTCDGIIETTHSISNIEVVEPIPLTADILEKNGFQYTNCHTLKGAGTYVLRLEQRGFDFGITIKLHNYFALDSYDDRMYCLAALQTGKWYVHELQHALLLCGIEKEIIL